MNHYYSVLGLPRNASKDEIKDAFKKLAMKFHPDKHANSPKAVKEGATLKFKQVSEAYEFLMNDLKRADYDHGGGSGRRSAGGFSSADTKHRNQYGYGYGSGSRSGDYYQYKERYADGRRGASGFEIFDRLLRSRAFLLNLAFASAIVGATFIIDNGRDKLRERLKSRKSLEEEIRKCRRMENARRNEDKKAGSGRRKENAQKSEGTKTGYIYYYHRNVDK